MKNSGAEKLQELLKNKLSNLIKSSRIEFGDVVVDIDRKSMIDFFKLLKFDTELNFDMLISVTAVDWLDSRDLRFEVVYHLLSLRHLHRLRIKVAVSENSPEVDSLCPLWGSANFMERETYDMYGIKFAGHPDLRRILMYDGFDGHPLRKDFPVQGKQARVPLLHQEVENSARNRIRPPLSLVNINPRRSEKGAQPSL